MHSRGAARYRYPPRLFRSLAAELVGRGHRHREHRGIYTALFAARRDPWKLALGDRRATAIIDALELDRRSLMCIVAAARPPNEICHPAQVEQTPGHPRGGHEHERQKACDCLLHAI